MINGADQNRRTAIFGIGALADSISLQIENLSDGVSETLFEPVIRLGVTGLSRSGKTVFITSLVANLLDRGRMPQFQAAASGRIRSAFLQPQPNDMVPRFDFEGHLADMTGPSTRWPQSTKAISQLRLSLKVQPTGFLSGFAGPKTIHLDIVDYPGEWLLDLPLLSLSYAQWCQKTFDLAKVSTRWAHAQDWLRRTDETDPAEHLQEPVAKDLAESFTNYLARCREDGFSACAPGRFLMPGDLEGSPALTFAPLPTTPQARRSSLYRAFERRFEAYKAGVVKPFFRDHFSRIERQIVLVDVLSALHAGPQAVEDLRGALADILTCFHPGANGWLSPLTGKKVEKLLFAATKADHLHHKQHPALKSITQALVRDAKSRADFAGAETRSLAIASLRTTVEEEISHHGEKLDCVRGTVLASGKQVAMYAGELPEDPSHLLNPARDGQTSWLNNDFSVMNFAPAQISIKPGDGPPHIRMDQACEFLLGDRLR